MKKGGKSSQTKAVKTASISKKSNSKKTAAKPVSKKSAKTVVKKKTAKKAVKKSPAKKRVVKKKTTKKAVKKSPAKKTVAKKKTAKKAVKKSPAKKSVVKKKTAKKAVKKSPAKKKARTATANGSKKSAVPKLPAGLEDLPPPPTFEDFTTEDYTTQYSELSHEDSVGDIGTKPMKDVSLTHDNPPSFEHDDSPVSLNQDTTTSDEQITTPVPEMKKKKSFFGRLFGKKEEAQEPVVSDTTDDVKVDETLEDITHKTQQDLDSLSVKNDVNAQSEIETVHARQEDYVANLRRRLDMEMQERQQHVQDAHADLNDREVELEQRHQQILSKEQEIAKNADKYEELKQLESQVEDKHITVEKRHQEIEDLKNQLSAKEQDLADKEDELAQREQEIKDKELLIEQSTPEPLSSSESVDDDSEDFMYRKKQISAVVTKPVVTDEPAVDMLTDKSRQIHTQLQEAYSSLHNSDVMEAKNIYINVTNLYKDLAKEQGQDAQLYQDILDLYKDIKLAMVQSI